MKKRWCVFVEYGSFGTDEDDAEFNAQLVDEVGKADRDPDSQCAQEWSCKTREQAEDIAERAYIFLLERCVGRGRKAGRRFSVDQRYDP